MKKKNEKIELVFLLDRSGSMGGLENDTIGGYNSLLNKNKNKDVKVTTVLFDNQVEFLHDRKDIKDVKEITTKEYYVRGCTALLDAIGLTINKISNSTKDRKVIFVITTDGLENASHEYNREQIKNMIEDRKDWEFMYLGANIDSYAEASSIGIRKERVSNYKATGKGTAKMFSALGAAVDCICEDRELSESWNKGLED